MNLDTWCQANNIPDDAGLTFDQLLAYVIDATRITDLEEAS